jgi:hypothetical protein
MVKNTASQKLTVFAWDSTTGLPKTGDAANITAYVSKDDGTVTQLGDTSATEQSSSNAPGYYLFDLTQAETNADKLMFSAKSSTSNIAVLAVPSVVYTVPANFTKTVIDVSGLVDANAVKVGPSGSGTAQTARDLGASVLLSSGTGTGQVSLSSGKVLLQATQTGVTIPTVTTLTNAPSDSSGVTTLLSRIPSGLFTGITSLAQWLGLLAGKQTGNSAARTEIRATGAGSGTFDETTDSQEAIRDRGDAAWSTATGFSTLDEAGVRTAVGLSSANLDDQLDALVPLTVTTGAVATGTNSATTFTTTLTETADDHWNDAFLVFTSGDLAGQVKRITDYDGTGKAITVSGGFTGTPADADTFAIVNR